MTKYREILRLRSLGLSQNDIASSCHVSKKTVNRVLKLAQEHNLRWPLEECLTDREIDKIIHPDGNTAKKTTDRKMPDFEHVKNELLRNGVNKKLLWAEYLEECRLQGAKPLMYSQFCHDILQDERVRRATMHICKTAVLHNRKHEDELNSSYREHAEHYGTAIIPARVRTPKDKASAEGTVGNISTWIIAALRNEEFFSIDELNHAIRKKLVEYNEKPFQKKEGSRKGLFDLEERTFLLPLPRTRYENASWRSFTVQFNYHICVDGNFYSVPFSFIGNPHAGKASKVP